MFGTADFADARGALFVLSIMRASGLKRLKFNSVLLSLIMLTELLVSFKRRFRSMTESFGPSSRACENLDPILSTQSSLFVY